MPFLFNNIALNNITTCGGSSTEDFDDDVEGSLG